MVKLTKEEFCLFNLKSKIQLVNKDGYFLNRRIVGDSYLISLYHLYNFYVEATYDISSVKTLGIDPVVNIQIIELYDVKNNYAPKLLIDTDLL
jgi:hypothetical protein